MRNRCRGAAACGETHCERLAMVDVVFALDEDNWGDTVRGTKGGLVGWRGRHGWVTWAGRITLVAAFSGPSRRPFIKFGETARRASRWRASKFAPLCCSTPRRHTVVRDMANTLLTDLHVRYIQNLGKVSSCYLSKRMIPYSA